jgi:hypothetical protein
LAEPSAQGNSSSSKSLLWMMLALFAGIAVLLSGGLFLASRVVRSLGLSASIADKDTLRVPGGSLRLQKESEMGPGLPVFPGAMLVLPDEQTTKEDLKQADSGLSKVVYHAADSRAVVDNWYAGHLGPEFTRHDAGEDPLPETLRDARVSASDIAFVAERGRQVRIVELALDYEGTKISLARFDRPAAP